MTALNLKHKHRTDPFYGKWHYSVSAYLPEVHSLRAFSHSEIDRRISVRRNVNWGGSWSYSSRVIKIDDDGVQDLHNVLDFLQQDQRPRKFLLYTHHIYFYCNEFGLANDFCNAIAHTKNGKVLETSQVHISGNSGTIYLKHPRHQQRTYLRAGRLCEKTAATIKAFMLSQPDIRMCPTFEEWCNKEWLYINSNFFFDHDHSGIIYMLGMIHPIIRKTMPIEPAK